MRRRSLLFCSLLVVCAMLSIAQAAVLGRLHGIVKDTEGKPLDKVTITIKAVGDRPDKYTTSTNAKGEYTHIAIQPGEYQITATKEGYAPVNEAYQQMVISPSDKGVTADFVLQKQQKQETKTSGSAKGVSLLNEGKVDEAIAELKKALEAKPDDAVTHYNLSVAYNRKQASADELKELQEAVRLKPDFGEAQLALGNVYINMKKFDAAVEPLMKAAAAFPTQYDVFYNLGVSYANSGKYAEAEAPFRKATEIKPSEPMAHYQLGMALLGQSKNADAKAELQKYLDLNPNAADKADVQELLKSL